MKIKGFIISGVLLTILGVGLCGFAATRDDFSYEAVYSDPTLEQKEYVFSSPTTISFQGEAEDLDILFTEGETKFVYYEGKRLKYSISDTNQESYSIIQEYETHFLNWNFFPFISKKCTLYVNSSVKNLHISMNAGNIILQDLNLESSSIDVDAGNVEIKSCNIDTLTAEVDAGNLKVNDSIIGTMKIDISAGNFNFKGDILSSAKVYMSAGNLKLELKRKKEEYTGVLIDIDVSAGKEQIIYGN